MSQWRVYNRHTMGLTHTEKFKGDEIKIKAGEFILMDYEDAVQFKGQMVPMREMADGTQDPATWKMIEIVKDGDAPKTETVQKVYVSHVDGKEFDSKSALEAYEKANFEHLSVKDEALDAEMEKLIAKSKPTTKTKEKTL